MIKIDNLKLSVLNLLFGLLFVFILIPTILKSILIAAVGLFIIYKAFKDKTNFNWDFCLNYGLLYIVLFFTIFISKDLSSGFYTLQSMASLIIFPIYFSLLSKKDFKKLNFNFFFWIYLISIFIFHLLVFSWFYITQFSFIDTFIHFQAIVTTLIGGFNLHPIYISMHCCIALFFSFFLWNDKLSNIKKYFLVFLQVTMFSLLLLHSKKGPLLAFLTTSIVYFILFQKTLNIKLYLLILVVLVAILFSVPKINNRFKEILKIEELTLLNENSTNIRFAVYKNSIELIKKSPIIGYGIGNYNQELKKSYVQKKQAVLLIGIYNSHNQYLSFLLMGGPLILIVYFNFFIKNFLLAFSKKNKIFILLIVFYSVVMLTENILERENGVIFFSFFLSLFGFKNYIKSEEE